MSCVRGLPQRISERESSKRKANSAPLFEELQLGTTYSALRHIEDIGEDDTDEPLMETAPLLWENPKWLDETLIGFRAFIVDGLVLLCLTTEGVTIQ